nr:TAXI family TRAP transporter solute-binding subunit [Bilophila wadsworthia]
MVKTVYSQEGVDYLGNVIAALKSMSPNLAVSYKPIPLHPGAERYFREIGLIKD